MARPTKRSYKAANTDHSKPLPPHIQRVISRGREYFYFQLNRATGEAGARIKIDNPWSEDEIARAYVLSGNSGVMPDWQTQLQRAYASAKGRARVDCLEFGIDIPFLTALLNRQGHRCAVSGIFFETAGYDDSRARPFGLSIDRVDSSRGYCQDNVRLVCRIANFAMGEWGLPALERLAEGISTRRRARTSAEPRIVKPVKPDAQNMRFTGGK